MPLRKLVKALLAYAFSLTLFSLNAAPAVAADACAAAKTKADCGKKPACNWSGKACAAKAAAKPAPAKPASNPAAAKAATKPAPAKTTAKPSTPKKPDTKPSEPAPAPAAPSDMPIDEEMPAGDGEAEDF